MGRFVRSRSPQISRPSRRLMSWTFGPSSGTGGSEQTVTATGSTLLTGAVTSVEDGLTIVRLRGELTLHLFTASTAGSGFFGAFGIGLASLQAVTIGVTAVPTPIDEEDADVWLYHRFFTIAAGDVMAAASASSQGLQSGNLSLRLEVDSKAMRKFPENMAMFAAIQVTESGTAAMGVQFNSRTLVKLP